jgi:hypothetical protein
MNSFIDWVVSEEFYYSESNDERRLVWLKISRPTQIDESQWSCSVSMDGIVEKYYNIFGENQFQSLQLALKFLYYRVESLMKSREAVFFNLDLEVLDWDYFRISLVGEWPN